MPNHRAAWLWTTKEWLTWKTKARTQKGPTAKWYALRGLHRRARAFLLTQGGSQ